MFHVKQFDVVVVGGGHAGCEASLACARMGLSTALVTMDPSKIAEMSCNPSIGGVGKGQLVREIDALGGEMGKNADFTGIQFKRLNTRKGSAVQSSRCQSDKKLYAKRMQKVISETPGLSVIAGEVKDLRLSEGKIAAVVLQTKEGAREEIPVKAVVITTGTFMQGLIHCGFDQTQGGRFGEKASVGLSTGLASLGFRTGRLKTGTPARLLRDSIDFSQMERQEGDESPVRFSAWNTEITLPQVPCFLTYSNRETHRVIRENLHRSPLYSGNIKGVGPRYCPSIEDKVVKFPDKDRHPLFFEPEALDSDWIYPNGISTSLPGDVQEAFIRTLPGCSEVKFARYGYAVEYDFVDPTQLKHTLETRLIGGLFLGGQVNGTSGYEEAAAQGLIAGINAGLLVKGEPPLELSRTESYIGVMVDDLVTLGVSEPYRMFTSRAEYRLSLREDNSDLRLSQYGYRVGLLSEAQIDQVRQKRTQIDSAKEVFSKVLVKPGQKSSEVLGRLGSAPLTEACSVATLLKRPEVSLVDIFELVGDDARMEAVAANLTPTVQETLGIEIKYQGYIGLQQEEIRRLEKLKDLEIPSSTDFREISGISVEAQEKLSRNRPRTLADAARISGVTPATLSAVLFHLRRKGGAHAAAPV